MNHELKQINELKICKYLSEEDIKALHEYVFYEKSRTNDVGELDYMIIILRDSSDTDYIGTIFCEFQSTNSVPSIYITTELEDEYDADFNVDYIDSINSTHPELRDYIKSDAITLNNWIEKLLRLSVESNRDYLRDFLYSKNKFMVNGTYLSSTEIPVELKEYFNTVGEVCNKCGCLLSKDNVWGEYNGHSILESIVYSCQNCGYSHTEKQDTSSGCKEEAIKYFGYNTGKYFSDIVKNPVTCKECNKSRVMTLMCEHTGRYFTWCPKCGAEYNEEYVSLPCESDTYWKGLSNPCYRVEWAETECSDDLYNFFVDISRTLGIETKGYIRNDVTDTIRKLKITKDRLVHFRDDICDILGIDKNNFSFHKDTLDIVKKLIYIEKHPIQYVLNKRKINKEGVKDEKRGLFNK